MYLYDTKDNERLMKGNNIFPLTNVIFCAQTQNYFHYLLIFVWNLFLSICSIPLPKKYLTRFDMAIAKSSTKKTLKKKQSIFVRALAQTWDQFSSTTSIHGNVIQLSTLFYLSI